MVFIFKTSVKTQTQAKKLKQPINNLLPKATWNFDLEDMDKILRIDSKKNRFRNKRITNYS
jgi:hypothetical protein